MTDRYVIFGNPIGHSRSPMIHAEFARQTGQDMTYEPVEAPLGGFAGALAAFIASGGKGCNVTVPFKIDAHDAATRRSPAAALAGAANTLKIEGGEIFADNTDGVGLVNDIERNMATPLAGRRILLIGAGGAARGALPPLLAAGPARLTIVNRTADKARALAEAVSAKAEGCGYGDLTGAYDVLINATSASLTGDAPPLPDSAFAPGALAYDMVYGKGLTPFLAQAKANGARRLADGAGMLVEQAAESFLIWRGVRPPTAALIAELSKPLD